VSAVGGERNYRARRASPLAIHLESNKNGEQMAHFIGEYQRCAEALAAPTMARNQVSWDAAGDLQSRALEVLLDQRTAKLADYHTKIDALIPVTENDTNPMS
jgi:hypothetical protein